MHPLPAALDLHLMAKKLLINTEIRQEELKKAALRVEAHSQSIVTTLVCAAAFHRRAFNTQNHSLTACIWTSVM